MEAASNIVYNRGGLSLHAGCEVFPGSGHAKSKTMLIVGLSGTGKTTTTFTTKPDAYLEDESLVPRVRG